MLGTILGLLTPIGGVTVFMYRKQNRRLKEAEAKLAEVNVNKAEAEAKAENWHIWEQQCDALHKMNQDLIQRNADLVRMNAEKEDRHQEDIKNWEERFTDQTQVLRNAQRNEKERADEVIRLTEENAALKVELAQVRCNDINCPFRQPPTADTPSPEGVTKDEYFSKVINANN